MYHDLDPQVRPLAQNHAVARLLASVGGGSGEYAEIYETDAPEVARKVPHLVMDADASQYSALVDVASGQHLALEGPPGSGKSQTIVNLIAAAVKDGKRVLFVAEKLTALDVVRNRLDATGLGEFVLPLQASKGSRDQVYESLAARLELGRGNHRVEEAHADQTRALESRRSVLQAYLDALASPLGETGMTVYEAVGHAIATADVRKPLSKEVRRAGLVGCEHLTSAMRDAILTDARVFADRHARRDALPALWRDATAIVLDTEDAEDFAEAVGELARDLSAWVDAARESAAAPLFGGDPLAADMDLLVALLGRLEAEADRLDPTLVASMGAARDRREVGSLLDDIATRRRLAAALARRLSDREGTPVARIEAAANFAADGEEGIDPEANLRCRKSAETAQRASLVVAHSARDLVAAWPEADDVRLARLAEIHAEIAAAPAEARKLRASNEGGRVVAAAKLLLSEMGRLASELEILHRTLPGAPRKASAEEVNRYADTIESAGMFRAFSGAYKSARNQYRNVLQGRSKKRIDIVAEMRAYAGWLRQVSRFAETRELSNLFGRLFAGFETDRQKIVGVQAFYELLELLSPDEGLHRRLETDDLEGLEKLAAAMRDYEFDGCLADLESILEHLGEVAEHHAGREDEARRHLALFVDRNAMSEEEAREIARQRADLDDLDGRIEESGAANVLGGAFQGVATDTDRVGASLRAAELASTAADANAALALIRGGRTTEILHVARELASRRRKIEIGATKFRETVGLASEVAATPALFARLEDLGTAASDSQGLVQASHLRRAAGALRRHGFGAYLDDLRGREASGDVDVVAEIKALMAKAIADRAYEMHADALSGYTGDDYAAIRSEIARKDRDLIQMSRKVVRQGLMSAVRPPRGNGIGRKSSYTEMALIENELAKKKRCVGVRELTHRAGTALQVLKPCWMMSPLAVAQYLGEGLEFDLVVIDEASQMTPENAIGAISRARQVVVVGDTKQLPPTSFFMKIMSEEELDEDMREDAESILDMANATFSPVRQLRWHYRSRHSGPIRFSNRWMYNDNLTIFPSASEIDPEMGVKLVSVRGTYANRTNHIEARAVIAAVVRFMEAYPDRSLGVVTMNTDQRELLLQEFERERDRNSRVDAYVRNWEERNDALEKFFVKNIETVQGDERDVMFISTLYGPESEGGRVMQRFGPVGLAHGDRRLNVLFTRAKEQIVTFTSMRPADILADGKSKGVQMLRGWLEYCATGAVPDCEPRGGEIESPFEAHVVRVVEFLGCEAVPQVGASGYRIDIGVRHPDWPHGFLLGVECDGATYHSSKSSRDRDRLRQEVLEGKGWVLHRIWSTDWFRDPDAEKEILKTRIKERLSEMKVEPRRSASVVSFEEMASARQTAEADRRPAASSEQADLPLEIKTRRERSEHPKGSVAVAPMVAEGIIEIGSKVVVERIEDGGRMSFTLTRDRNDPENGAVSVETPLGQALIDCEEGEKVPYVVGSYVREVRVMSVS